MRGLLIINSGADRQQTFSQCNFEVRPDLPSRKNERRAAGNNTKRNSSLGETRVKLTTPERISRKAWATKLVISARIAKGDGGDTMGDCHFAEAVRDVLYDRRHRLEPSIPSNTKTGAKAARNAHFSDCPSVLGAALLIRPRCLRFQTNLRPVHDIGSERATFDRHREQRENAQHEAQKPVQHCLRRGSKSDQHATRWLDHCGTDGVGQAQQKLRDVKLRGELETQHNQAFAYRHWELVLLALNSCDNHGADQPHSSNICAQTLQHSSRLVLRSRQTQKAS